MGLGFPPVKRGSREILSVVVLSSCHRLLWPRSGLASPRTWPTRDFKQRILNLGSAEHPHGPHGPLDTAVPHWQRLSPRFSPPRPLWTSRGFPRSLPLRRSPPACSGAPTSPEAQAPWPGLTGQKGAGAFAPGAGRHPAVGAPTLVSRAGLGTRHCASDPASTPQNLRPFL